MINIETVDGCGRIDEITSAYNVKMLDTVVLGRTDLCNSMNVKDVDPPEVLAQAPALFTRLKQRSIRCLVGGGVTPKTAAFLRRLDGLVDAFETLKVVFGDYARAAHGLEEGIRLALEYELNWYRLKQEYYQDRYGEDGKKIDRLSS